MKDGSIFKYRKELRYLSKPVISLMNACVPIKKNGYAPVRHTPALWKHDTMNTMLTLVLDDFRIKFTSRRDSDHLASVLEGLYVIKKDWEGNVLGLTLNWDYTNITVDVSTPKYVEEVLQKIPSPKPSETTRHTPPMEQAHIWGSHTVCGPRG